MRAVPALLFLVAVAGCDATGDLDPYEGAIVVSLAEGAATQDVSLRLVAVDDVSCADPLVATYSRERTAKRVTVEGIDRPEGATCMALISPAAVVPLELGPEPIGGYSVEVAHAGAVDLYSLDLTTPGGPTLTAVRTTTTRLAESGIGE